MDIKTIGEMIKEELENQDRITFIKLPKLTDSDRYILQYRSNIITMIDKDMTKIQILEVDKAIKELKEYKLYLKNGR